MPAFNSIMSIEDANVNLAKIIDLCRDRRPWPQDQISALLNSVPTPERDLLLGVAIKEFADSKYKVKNYTEAIKSYRDACLALLGFAFDFPSFNDSYAPMYRIICQGNNIRTNQYFVVLVSVLRDLAQCFFHIDEYLSAIDWVMEIEKLYTLHLTQNTSSGYPWDKEYEPFTEFAMVYMEYHMLLARIFQILGNTASSAYYRYICKNHDISSYSDIDELEIFQKQNKFSEMAILRHPNFKNVHKRKIVCPPMQLRGSWKNLHVLVGPRPRGRSGFSAWIWKSSLYIYGGTNYYRRTRKLTDLWCLDLSSMHSWRRLPSHPRHETLSLSNTKMCIWEDEAWLFFGMKSVYKFTLATERWTQVDTKYSGLWPYRDGIAFDYCAEVFEGNLHIFGGADSLESVGINLHMSLDLRTSSWSKLGGTIDSPTYIQGMPLLRKAAGSWIIPEERRMYVLYGYATRTPKNVKEPDYQLNDMWTYSFDDKKWARERFRGNIPSPRSKMACAYNPVLRQAILYGGCNMQIPSYDKEYTGKRHKSTYLGDAFIFDPSLRRWREVLTQSFPHYRMGSQAIVDSATGRTYLYGGSCSSDLRPSKNADETNKTISFGDLWELNLNLSESSSGRDDCVSKAQLKKFGPWKLCFGCKEYKLNMFKCAGKCGGKIFLCSADCQRRCWKEHRRRHHCGKI